MIVRRLFQNQLAQTSYLVVCEHNKVGLVVDPNRHTESYLDAAAAGNIKIIAVAETHIHADFVSGSRELAKATGATLYLSGAGGPDWEYRFAKESGAQVLADHSTFTIGDIRVEALHTPGHTPEHMSFLLTDTAVASEPMGALTGDFIFVGDVGRPDLLERAAGMAGTMEASARVLFKSLAKFKERPDYLQLWPGHGAGSACGKALGAMPQTTLGYERLFNWALAEADEERFVAEVLAGQPEPPAYFAIMKRVNRDGPAPRSAAVPPTLDASAVAAMLDAGAVVVDTRLAAEFAKSHAVGSIHLPRNKSFLNWAGALLPYDADLTFIGDSSEDQRKSLASDLSLIGIERIAGVFPDDFLRDLEKFNVELTTSEKISTADARADENASIIDVRGRSEFAAGHIPVAVNIPLVELQNRIAEIPAGKVIVHCQGGSRSAIAASILQRRGRNDVLDMAGGFSEWERAGLGSERGHRAD
ncbi:MAG: MBL fold metallo-hydrolase [Gemmatimonadaceae bacterium]